jgi:hypothetical protein
MWCEKCGEWMKIEDYCSHYCSEHLTKIQNAEKAAALAHDLEILKVENELLRIKLVQYMELEKRFNPTKEDIKRFLVHALSKEELEKLLGDYDE